MVPGALDRSAPGLTVGAARDDECLDAGRARVHEVLELTGHARLVAEDGGVDGTVDLAPLEDPLVVGQTLVAHRSLRGGGSRLAEVVVDTSVFGASVFAELTEGPVRHALIDLGGGMALHPFEFTGRPTDAPYGEMFQRGHLDHVSLNVPDEETFDVLRRRLVERGASDGDSRDFGAVRTVAFPDPDGWWGEIAIWTGGDPVPLDQAVTTTLS